MLYIDDITITKSGSVDWELRVAAHLAFCHARKKRWTWFTIDLGVCAQELSGISYAEGLANCKERIADLLLACGLKRKAIDKALKEVIIVKAK